MRHVLIYSEERGLRRFLGLVLQSKGYVITEVAVMDQALMTLRSTLHPVVTVMQLDTPSGPGGMAFFERIRAAPDLYGAHRFVAASSGAYSQDELDLLDGLGVTVLHPPFAVEELLEQIDRAFESLP